MPVRKAEARWEGDLPNGSGTMKMANWEGPFSATSRFEEGSGTNPEELLAAAHAGCFSMALSGVLANAGHIPNSIDTTARVHIEKKEAGWTITRVDLTTQVDVPGLDDSEFQQLANTAKENCPVSRLFKGADITLEARLSGG